jgi:transposase-like protein
VIVWPCRLDVSTYAALGRDVSPPRPACPRCGGPTGPWSGYLRHLRDAVDLHRIFVPRVRCRRCGRTAALLPWFVTPYRWDTVDVIGRALELAVGGQGVRRIAATVGRPETTVREWCRRFRATADALARVLLAAAVRSGWSGFDLPVAPGSRCLAAADALGAAWARRHGPGGAWRIANLVTGGAWLASNTTSPLAPLPASSLMARTPRTTPGGDRWPATRQKHSPSGGTT